MQLVSKIQIFIYRKIPSIDFSKETPRPSFITKNEYDLPDFEQIKALYSAIHEMILNKNIKYLYSKIINSNILKILFPSDFTLPELQKVYEQVLDKPLDRRNFRKKFIALDLVEDTLEKNTGFNGRPAKLYRFKDDIKERNLF